MPNPLTGVADADYTNRRPVAVTLRTLEGAAPQWGLSSADVLVEGVSEGTTASLMALYSSVDNISKAGPVGPGRDLLLQMALPLNALPVHIDKNIYASNLLNTLTYQDLDGYHIGKAAFAFDQDRQNAGYREENCWYTTGELIKNGLNTYGTSLEGANTPLFVFGERPAVEESARNATALTIAFSPDDSEQLNYAADTGLYVKTNADGSPTVDADNGQQVAFTNVLVLYASSGIKDDGYTRDYDLTGGHRPLPDGRRLGADPVDQGGRHRPAAADGGGRQSAGGQPRQELHRHLGRLLRPEPDPHRRRRHGPDPAREARPAGERRQRRGRCGGPGGV